MRAKYNAANNWLEEESEFKHEGATGLIIQCAPECKDIWEDGQVLKEGVDYYRNMITRAYNEGGEEYTAPDWIVYPLKQSISIEEDQNVLFNEIGTLAHGCAKFTFFSHLLDELNKKYTITRKP